MEEQETIRSEAPRKQKREPKKMEILGFLMLVAATACVTTGALRWQDKLTVEAIAVEGNRIVPTEEIVALTRITAGSKLSGVELTAIRSRLLHNAFIKDAVIRREYPSQIGISIVERTPAAFLNTRELLTCDAEGIILPHIASPEVMNLPLISGMREDLQYEPGTALRDSLAKEALAVLLAAEKIDPPTSQMISEIRPTADGMILTTTDGGVPIIIGRGRIAEKLAILASFWKEVVLPETARQPESIDMRYEDQVIVRWAGNARTSVQPG